MQRSKMHPFIAATVLALAGCSGGSAGLTPAAPAGLSGAVTPVTGAAEIAGGVDTKRGGSTTASVSAINSIGATVTALADESSGEAPKNPPAGNGVCHSGVEFFVPDKAGDANSTEREYFFDSACTQLSRDTVRIYTSTGTNSEAVDTTVKNYAFSGGALLATRTGQVLFSNATFGSYGWPVEADGFVREASSQLVVGTRTIDSDNEFVIAPSTGSTQSFCTDWAGYNATGVARLHATFGWAGGILSGGTRTINSDGSVTWTGTRDATLYEGAIGSLGVNTGTQNSSCPISTPAYSITGGTQKGTSTGTITVTLDEGTLRSLQINRQSQSGGYSLTASSNSGVSPNSPNFITGSISRGGAQVATFSVNAVGDGTLKVNATGATYNVAGWVVVR